MTPSEQKATLRAEMRQRLRHLSAAEKVAASVRVCARLPQLPCWGSAATILFYAPLPDEIDLWPLLTAALAAGKTVALPRYRRAHRDYEARQVEHLPRDLQTGFWGIREPRASCQKIPLNQLDLVLVPGVAFSVDGVRLGRGKGYYDRLLAQVAGYKCGVGFDCQMGQWVPAEPHDIRLNCLVSPSHGSEIAPSGTA